jgi:hypothetical protein
MSDTPSSASGLSAALVGAIAVVIAAIIGAAGGFAAAYFGFLSKDQELKVHLVEIAVGILRADPKEGVTPARGWALDVIDKYSGVPLSNEDRVALLHKPLDFRDAIISSHKTIYDNLDVLKEDDQNVRSRQK